MAFRALRKPESDIFSIVLELCRAVFSAQVDRPRNLHCARGMHAAANRISQKVLENQTPAGLVHLYNLNLALRAMVYDLQDTHAIPDAHAEAILAKSFELERRHLMRSILYPAHFDLKDVEL